MSHLAPFLMLLLTTPVAVLAVMFADPVTRLVYEYGHFQAADTLRTAQTTTRWEDVADMPPSCRGCYLGYNAHVQRGGGLGDGRQVAWL